MALAAAFVIPAVAEGSTACGSPGGPACFTVTVTAPAEPIGTAGVTGEYSVKITNESAHRPLSSVTITAPGFTIGSGTSESLSLSLAPLGTTTVPVTAATPCVDGTYTWAATGPSDGDNDSDDFQLASTPSVSVTGSCKLAFDPSGQPNQTLVGGTITSGVKSSGGPVLVDFLDANGNPMTTSGATVQVSLGSGPVGATLSGTTTALASGGQASFGNLSIGTQGLNYSLTASTQTPGISPGTSAYFDVLPTIQSCSTSPCSSSVSNNTTTTGFVSTAPATTGQFLGIGLGGVSLSCGPSYPLTSDPISFDVFSATGAPQNGALVSAVLEISKAAVKSSGHPGASSWQICYASPNYFAAQPGTGSQTQIDGLMYYTGLLPDCSSPAVAPCVQSRNKTNAGVEVVTFLATGDPVWRG